MMDDLISRKALLEELQKEYDNAHRILQNQYSPETQECCKMQLRTLHSVIKDVKEAPTIEAELVRHGEWIKFVYDTRWVKCSECRCNWERRIVEECSMAYCPNCGAKNDGGKKDG